MRRSAIFLLLFAPLIGCFFKFASGISESETSLSNPYPRKSTSLNLFKSLLPPALSKNDVALAVTLDGKIYMVDTNTRNIEWTFSSGSPIHSSFQNLTHFDNARTTTADDFFVDVGEDWALYLHSNRLGKVKLSSSAEEYIRNTPYVAEDGGVTLGSKRTTVFVVDAKSGKLIHTYRLAETPSTLRVQSSENGSLMKVEDADELVESGSEGLETVEQLLYIMRTDYALQHYSAGTNNVLWNVSFSEFDADFRFPNTGNALGEDRGVSDSILPYRMKPIILRIPDPSLMESHSVFDRLSEGHPGGIPIFLPAPHQNLPAVPAGKIPLPPLNNEGREMLALPSPEIEDSRILGTDDRGAGKMNITSMVAEYLTKFSVQSLFLFVITLLSIMGSIFRCSHGKQRKPKNVAKETKVQDGVSKKKKNRRLANIKKNANDEKNMRSNMSHEYKAGEPNESTHNEKSEKKFFLTSTDFVDGQIEGRRIGKLLVSNNEIAKGSNGTIVLEGFYDGRPVAVKRLVRTHHDVAVKEIQNLIASDQHPNIVRWYGVEYDQDFVYLSLERCACSLNDLIYFYSESFQSQIITKDQDPHFLTEYTIRLHSMMENNKDIELWKANGYPSPQLLKLMSDLISGLAHLHELGIIHRDLKPQNVLVIKGKSLCAKLSDMGISKRLQGDQSSITQHATGYGSSGWQAPEQLCHQRQTRAVDLFSLGCLLFFCVTGGKHPYGDSIERDVNIVNDRKDLFLVEAIPEAVDLFTRLLDPNPDMRPTAADVLHHPFFWNSEMRLSFLRDASDRVELEDRENSSELLNSLESTATVALNGKWDEKMESAFINNIGRYRRYKFDSVRDLLRVIRNKLNHYRELPQEIQEILGPAPEGFDGYFSSRFPRLLIEVYKVLYSYCKEEKFFCKYIKSNRM